MTTKATREYPHFRMPDVEQLEAKALAYIKECKPKEYKAALKNGTLQHWLDLKVEACQATALSLIQSGMWAGETWNLAIHQEILDSNTD